MAGSLLGSLKAVGRRLPSWRPKAQHERRGPRIGLVGNCQVGAMADVMRCLVPNATVTFETVHGIGRRHGTMRALVAAYAECDVVFANRLLPAFASFQDGGDFDAFRAGTRLVQIPIVVFAAYHPDLVFVGDPARKRGSVVRTPAGPQNSALALFGFRAGLSPDETRRLFGREAFGRLGYLSGWDPSLAALADLGADAGFDLAAQAVVWSRRGAFMHSVQHPKLFVIADLARLLLQRAGIAAPALDLESCLEDDLLAQGSWPVYPEIGDSLGVAGDSRFLTGGRTHQDGPACLDLAGFLAGSFAAYRSRPPADLAHPRVDPWLADDALRADLVHLARTG